MGRDAPSRELRIGGFVPLSTTDWPGMLSAVVFCQGCAWNCRYCHNPHLIHPRGDDAIHWPDLRTFLDHRRGLLDAVVFSGGEPTLQPALADAMRDARAMGFKIGLHTAGVFPERLAACLPWVDWIGIDVKAPFDDYARVTGVPGSGATARESLDLVLASGADYEVRTTVHSALLGCDDLIALAEQLANLGARGWVIQHFRADGCTDRGLKGSRHVRMDVEKVLATRFGLPVRFR